VTVSLSKYLPWQAMHFYDAPPTSRKRAVDSGTGGFEFTNFLNGPRSCSVILKGVKGMKIMPLLR
jgi:hypothetical protein